MLKLIKRRPTVTHHIRRAALIRCAIQPNFSSGQEALSSTKLISTIPIHEIVQGIRESFADSDLIRNRIGPFRFVERALARRISVTDGIVGFTCDCLCAESVPCQHKQSTYTWPDPPDSSQMLKQNAKLGPKQLIEVADEMVV